MDAGTGINFVYARQSNILTLSNMILEPGGKMFGVFLSLAPLLYSHTQTGHTPPAPLNTHTDNAENISFLLIHYIKV